MPYCLVVRSRCSVASLGFLNPPPRHVLHQALQHSLLHNAAQGSHRAMALA